MDLYAEALRLPRQLQPTRPQPVAYRDLRCLGLTEGAVRSRASRQWLLRPHHGIYLEGPELPNLLDRARAALCAAPPLAVLGFQTAAQLYGFGVVRTSAIHLLVPAGTPFPQRPGIAAHQVVLPIGPPVELFGLPCAPPARCAIDLARVLPRHAALPVLDAALFSEACQPEHLEREVIRHRGLAGVRQARDLVPLADHRSECRQESQLRLLLHDGGLRGFVPQLPVLDDFGRVRHRLDLGDPEHLVAVEYDGSSHLDSRRLYADRIRHNWLSERGWSIRYFTARDLHHHPHNVIQTVTAARRSRANSSG
jgi:very-short-patch-repair endonuclease